MSRTLLVAVVIALVLALAGPGRAEAAPPRPVDTYEATAWSETAIDVLVTNKKVIARCFSTTVFLGYSAWRSLSAAALHNKVFDILSFAQNTYGDGCRTTVEVAKVVLMLWRIGGRDGRSFTFSDDSRVVDKKFGLNYCYFDVTIGDAATGNVWRYQASYRLCSTSTYQA